MFPGASGVPMFSWKDQRSKSSYVKNLHNLASLRAADQAPATQLVADWKLGLTIVRPNLLSAPETLDNGMDGRISCRYSAPTSFLVFK